MLDAAARLYLKHQDYTPLDCDGKNVGEAAQALAKILGRLQNVSSRLHCFAEILYIDPATNKGYAQHKSVQNGLEGLSRRLQSASSFFTAAKHGVSRSRPSLAPSDATR